VFPELRKHLLQVRDIEKICRQLSVKRLYPSSIYYLHQTIRTLRGRYITYLKKKMICNSIFMRKMILKITASNFVLSWKLASILRNVKVQILSRNLKKSLLNQVFRSNWIIL